VFGVWYLIIYSRRFRKSVRVESKEALEILNREFSTLQTELRNQESLMQASRKTKKLTNAESAMVESLDKALQNSQNKVVKEIDDIRKLVRNDNK
jgi:archaellum biogenesis ATPase FlaH